MHDGQIVLLGKINFPTDLGLCRIEVHGSDEDVAHFHVINNKYDIRIKIFYPEYYGEQQYFLNNPEKNFLQNFLINTYSGLELSGLDDMTIWNKIVLMWTLINDFYSNYPEKEKVSEFTIPNYYYMEDKKNG